MSDFRIMPIIRRFASEPLPQFIAIGLALFGFAHLMAGRDARPEIVVDAAQRDYQRNQFRGQFGADPDPERLEELLRTHVRDEVLYREALRLGLQQDDEIIRRRLIQKMEFLLAEGSAVPAPTPEQLRAYLAAHPEGFTRPGSVSFEQRFFSDDQARAAEALKRIGQAGSIASDVFTPGERFEAMDPLDARKLFGDSPFVAALDKAEPGRWAGPYRSGYGWHLLRVIARQGPATPAFEDVEDAVREAWLRDAREKASVERIEALVKGYRIRVEAGAAAK